MLMHRGAFDYDLRSRLRLSARQVEEGDLSWNDAVALTRELIRDPYSHSFAALAGYEFVPAPEDVQFYNWVDATAQMNHRSGKVAPTPAKRPWVGTGVSKVGPVTEDSRERRRRLAERLGVSDAE